MVSRIIILLSLSSANIFAQSHSESLLLKDPVSGNNIVFQKIQSTKALGKTVVADNILVVAQNGAFYKRVFDRVDIRWFGAMGDTVTDDSQAFLKAVSSLRNIGGGILFVPKGNYKLSKTITVDFDNLAIQGDGSKNSVLLINHEDYGIIYNSPSQDLSTARFTLKSIGLKYAVKTPPLPTDQMQGKGILCQNMHASTWEDVYVENFHDALVLEDSYLNVFTNFFAQSNWRGLLMKGGSNGNTFYGGAQRNSSVDLRGKAAEKNLFVNIDIEPASTTQYVGNNNTFQNCRFERFNLLSKNYSLPWFVLGSNNTFIHCNWYWNFEDRPRDYMMIIEGNRNNIELTGTLTTSKLILLKPKSYQNNIKYFGDFEDKKNTKAVWVSENFIQDLGDSNSVSFSDNNGKVMYNGVESFSGSGKFTNYLTADTFASADVNVGTLKLIASDITPPMNVPSSLSKKIVVANDGFVRRTKLGKSFKSDGSKYAASAFIYIPPKFSGNYVSISAVEGQYVLLDVKPENRNRWVRVFGYFQPDKNTDMQFTIDTDAKKDDFFYISAPVLSNDLLAAPIY